MRLIITLILAVTFIVTPAFAWDDDPYGSNGESEYKYEGYSGQRYKYDLSDPSDRLEYQVDPEAQMMDRINPSPLIELDRNSGQYGGGAEW